MLRPRSHFIVEVSVVPYRYEFMYRAFGNVGRKVSRDITIRDEALTPSLYSVPNMLANPSMAQPVNCSVLSPSPVEMDNFLSNNLNDNE